MDILIAIALVVGCFFVGSSIEQSHLQKLRKRETELKKTPCITFGKAFSHDKRIKNSQLVHSSVVIGCDYFKMFYGAIENFFGGNVSAYETVLDRARREAILRMKESALSINAQAIINVKIETVMLDPIGCGKNNQKVSVTAYGTAIEYDLSKK